MPRHFAAVRPSKGFFNIAAAISKGVQNLEEFWHDVVLGEYLLEHYS